MNSYITLNKLDTGCSCIIKQIDSKDIFRRRMLDLGFIPNTIVKSIFKSPSNDPTAYEVRGTVIALRSEESSKIIVEEYFKEE